MTFSGTFYWHDYETFGIDPGLDRPAQFAGIRTDTDFNIIDDPLVIYCKLPLDYLPQPDSCLITGITPQFADQNGFCETEFIRYVHTQLIKPNTCTIGYNNLRFDDEVTRFCLYRNFYDPYAREWQNGNSRWDLIDVLRAARALRPEGVTWPVDEEGKPSLRLDKLTIANGIVHESAHDALSDVYATIAIAKLVRQAQPKLYQYLYQHRGKAEVLGLLQLGSNKPVVHISGRYSTEKSNLAVVLPICKHPTNNNGIIVYDLSIDPEMMLILSEAEIRQRVFTAKADLPENVERIPLKTVHINKCPVLAPISVIREVDAERLGINLDVCEVHLNKIKADTGLHGKLTAVFGKPNYTGQDQDPDLAIYSGGFFSDKDKQLMAKIRAASARQLAELRFEFQDRRLAEMLFRYRARNYPDSLNPEELVKWRKFCVDRLENQGQGTSQTFQEYYSKINGLAGNSTVQPDILKSLSDYADDKLFQLKGNAD